VKKNEKYISMNIYIKTYGCQMNERDSEAIAAELLVKGFKIVANEKEADVLIFNTCSVRDQAEIKAVGKVGILKRLKKVKPNIFIGIIGCMAQRRGESLLKELPHVDFVIGTEQLTEIPNIIEKELQKREKITKTETRKELVKGLDLHIYKENRISDFVAVMRGCDMFCAYCIVPYVRGREKSRPIPEVVEEVKTLAAKGIKEIVLLGQNVSSYGLNQSATTRPLHSPFAKLLTEVNEIDGIERIRFLSPHPYFFNDELINAIADLPKVCKSIHLPLQSGSDRILKKMNRRYNSEIYMDVVEKLKARIPGVTFSTDVIVAFPGETDEDFALTRNVMNEVGFDNAYLFKYSPREGTPAAKYDDQISKEVKEERHQILLKDLADRTKINNKKLEGQTFEILVEGPSKRNSERWSGRTTGNNVVMFEPISGLKLGDLVNVTIKRSTSMTLFGDIVG
jgi:tRNA-2-methylthio-N6-dimethylallyladenosine synthase